MSSRPFRLAIAAAFLTALLVARGAARRPPPPAPNDLTVAGKPVSGSDCVTAGNGGITITNPVFGTQEREDPRRASTATPR